MTSIEHAFERELEIFRTEAEAAAQFFYSYLAIHDVAKRRKQVFQMLNENALFWNTLVGGVQTAALIGLGRVFDQKSKHNVDVLIRSAQENPDMFSKAALGKRKQGNAVNEPPWLPGYLRTAYEPTTEDFRRLRRHVQKYRRIYNTNYRELRNEYYAHKEAATPSAVAVLVAKTNIREMQRLFVFLLQLHQALRQLFDNGRKPVLQAIRYSAQRMSTRPSRQCPGDSVHERIMIEAGRALVGIRDEEMVYSVVRSPRRSAGRSPT